MTIPFQLLGPESAGSPEAQLEATLSLLPPRGRGPLGLCQQSSRLGLLSQRDLGSSPGSLV